MMQIIVKVLKEELGCGDVIQVDGQLTERQVSELRWARWTPGKKLNRQSPWSCRVLEAISMPK